MKPTHRRRLLSFVLVFALFSLLTPSLISQAPLRILCMGDSITEGTTAAWSAYRGALSNQLATNHHCVDFVGTRRGVVAPAPNTHLNDPVFPVTDQDHFGFTAHPTFLVHTQLNQNPTVQGDVVLIHLGTNDVAQNAISMNPLSAQQVADLFYFFLKSIVIELQNRNPSTQIFIAEIIPIDTTNFSAAAGALITATLPRVNAKVRALAATGSNITAVDMHTPFTNVFATHYIPDGVHLNQTGATQMANIWFQAIQGVLPPNPSPNTACLREIGRGCAPPGTASEPRLTLTNGARPQPGTTLAFAASAVPTGSIVSFGLSTTNPSGLAMPNTNDCRHFVGLPPVTMLLSPPVGNTVAFNFTVPANAPIGSDLFAQVAIADPSSQLLLTNGIWMRVGN